MVKSKLSSLFIAGVLLLSSCTGMKLATQDVEGDPVYATRADIKHSIHKEEIAKEREALENGAAMRQGKRSGTASSKYDYMPATSYAQRFNRTGNSFFISDPYARRISTSTYVSVGIGSFNGMNRCYGSTFTPFGYNAINYNPWNRPFRDPWMSYYWMQSNPYPFFTYNPYMYSFNLLNNRYDPWMMSNSYYNPYLYNPYYAFNPYGYYNPCINTYRTASAPRRSYVSQRRTSTMGTSSSSSGGSGRSSGSSTAAERNTHSSGNNNSTFNRSGAGSTRGGYSTGGSNSNRSSSSGTRGSKRR